MYVVMSTYPGSGRPTGQVVFRGSEDAALAYLREQSDLVVDALVWGDEDEIEAQFLVGEHNQGYHLRRDWFRPDIIEYQAGCPACQLALAADLADQLAANPAASPSAEMTMALADLGAARAAYRGAGTLVETGEAADAAILSLLALAGAIGEPQAGLVGTAADAVYRQVATSPGAPRSAPAGGR